MHEVGEGAGQLSDGVNLSLAPGMQRSWAAEAHEDKEDQTAAPHPGITLLSPESGGVIGCHKTGSSKKEAYCWQASHLCKALILLFLMPVLLNQCLEPLEAQEVSMVGKDLLCAIALVFF